MTDAISPDGAERLLNAPDGSPLGETLARLRDLSGSAAPDAGDVVPQMAVAAAKGSSWFAYAWLFRPRGIVLAKLLAVVATTSVVTAGGLAATDNLPAFSQPDESPAVAPPVTAVATTSTSTTVSPTTTSTTVTTSTTSTTIATTTTTVATPAGTQPSPGRCPALDATIVDGTAKIATTPTGVQTLSMTMHTTGTVDSAAAHIGGVSEVALTPTAPGTWIGTTQLAPGNHTGERMLFTVLGCGADQLDAHMTSS